MYTTHVCMRQGHATREQKVAPWRIMLNRACTIQEKKEILRPIPFRSYGDIRE